VVQPLWPPGRLGDYIERGGLGAAVRGFVAALGSGGWSRGYDFPTRGGRRRDRRPPPAPPGTPPINPTPGVGQTNPRVPTGPTAAPFLILDDRFFGKKKRKRRAATAAEEAEILRRMGIIPGRVVCRSDAECEELWGDLDPSPWNKDYNREEIERRVYGRIEIEPYNPADDPLLITEQAIPTRRLWSWFAALPKRMPRPLRRTPRRTPKERPNPARPGPTRRGRPDRRPGRRTRPGQPVIPVPGPMFPGRPGNPPAPAQPPRP